jgi:L-asparaginase
MTARVTVIALGGTISMAPSETGGVTPTLGADALLDAVPGLADTGIEITARNQRRVAGSSVTFTDLTELTALVSAELAAGADGVVITQGTDTIEETAFFLDRTVATDRPVVVTGAMRPASAAGADGPANVLAAVRVAASTEATGLGALVVFSDEIHAARLVRKTHTTSTATFVSPGFGPLGWVVEGRVRLPLALHVVPVLPVGDLEAHRVAVIPIALGDDGELLRRAAPAVEGIVLAAMGVGHVPDRVVPVVTELLDRVPVVLASRTGAGSVLRWTYRFPGSERDLRDRGVIGAGFLDPYKASILLRLLVAAGADRPAIAAAFERFE